MSGFYAMSYTFDIISEKQFHSSAFDMGAGNGKEDLSPRGITVATTNSFYHVLPLGAWRKVFPSFRQLISS